MEYCGLFVYKYTSVLDGIIKENYCYMMTILSLYDKVMLKLQELCAFGGGMEL